MTDKRQSDALHLADIADDGAWTFVIGVRKEIAAELRRQYAEIETLRTGYEAARLEIESLRGRGVEPAGEYPALPGRTIDELTESQRESAIAAYRAAHEQDPDFGFAPDRAWVEGAAYVDALAAGQATAAQQPGAAYAALPEPALSDDLYCADMMRAFADATHALRVEARVESLAAAYREELDKLSQRNYELRLASRGQAPAQAAPAYKDSTPELHIGDSAFESWYSSYSPAHKSDKQRSRDAYAAGMGDPLVTAAPAAVAGPSDPSITLDFKHATELLKMFGGEPGLVTLQHGNERSHSGAGLYAWYSDLPEEGAVFLGAEPEDEAAPITHPAPKQEAQSALFDKQGFREWVLLNLPYDTIIGNSAYWADHLSKGIPRFVKAAPADSVLEDAARYRWLREGNDEKHGAAWHVAVNLYGCEWDAAIDAARKQGASHD